MAGPDDFQQVLKAFKIEPAQPSDALREMLTARMISVEAQELLFRHLMGEPLDLEVTLFPEDGVLGCNSDEFCPLCLRDGLIAVGWTGNGDFVVMDLTENLGVVGFVSHELMWLTTNVREAFHPVSSSLADFIALSVQGRMPIDYDEALKTLPRL